MFEKWLDKREYSGPRVLVWGGGGERRDIDIPNIIYSNQPCFNECIILFQSRDWFLSNLFTTDALSKLTSPCHTLYLWAPCKKWLLSLFGWCISFWVFLLIVIPQSLYQLLNHVIYHNASACALSSEVFYYLEYLSVFVFLQLSLKTSLFDLLSVQSILCIFLQHHFSRAPNISFSFFYLLSMFRIRIMPHIRRTFLWSFSQY